MSEEIIYFATDEDCKMVGDAFTKLQAENEKLKAERKQLSNQLSEAQTKISILERERDTARYVK